jgi:outer membrane cobalamin receptor
MKISGMIKSAAVLLILAVAASEAVANPPNDQSSDRYAYVMVTGSRIPQKVKISPIGTRSFSAMSVWDRRQINQTGRQTAEGVLAQDPSVRVFFGHSGSGQ